MIASACLFFISLWISQAARPTEWAIVQRLGCPLFARARISGWNIAKNITCWVDAKGQVRSIIRSQNSAHSAPVSTIKHWMKAYPTTALAISPKRPIPFGFCWKRFPLRAFEFLSVANMVIGCVRLLMPRSSQDPNRTGRESHRGSFHKAGRKANTQQASKKLTMPPSGSILVLYQFRKMEEMIGIFDRSKVFLIGRRPTRSHLNKVRNGKSKHCYGPLLQEEPSKNTSTIKIQQMRISRHTPIFFWIVVSFVSSGDASQRVDAEIQLEWVWQFWEIWSTSLGLSLNWHNRSGKSVVRKACCV